MRSIVIALLLISLAGCAESAPAQAEPDPPEEPQSEYVERTFRISGSPACPDESGRHQASISHSGTYTFLETRTPSVQVYEESNGMTGLQTEEGCPQAPDTRLA